MRGVLTWFPVCRRIDERFSGRSVGSLLWLVSIGLGYVPMKRGVCHFGEIEYHLLLM